MRVLIGAGVARCVIGWKLLPIKYKHDFQGTEQLQSRLQDRTGLLSYAEHFDMSQGTDLETTLQRLPDDRIATINIMRFAVGASLTYSYEGINWQQQWAPLIQRELKAALDLRRMNLATALAIFEPDSAFTLYDDNAPDLFIALSFPMTQGEESSSFAIEKP